MLELIKERILKDTNSSNIEHIQLIQNLWSGYGQLSRIKLGQKPYILKHVNFPVSDKSNSHLRKVKSYQVELNWYKKYNQSHDKINIPKYIHSGATDSGFYLILEDLAEKQFVPKRTINEHELKYCLIWLANFHKTFLNITPSHLWEIGTYWHLDTRPDEFELIQDRELKNAAQKIDHILNQAKFKTFVHGDAKLSNFLFNDTATYAVDFQYIGGGVGIKDVAYFMSSVFDEEELEEKEQMCLDTYFYTLNIPEVEKEWRELYSFAWCDFYRFLKGWAPDHWKINSYSEKMKDKVLKCI